MTESDVIDAIRTGEVLPILLHFETTVEEKLPIGDAFWLSVEVGIYEKAMKELGRMIDTAPKDKKVLGDLLNLAMHVKRYWLPTSVMPVAFYPGALAIAIHKGKVVDTL